MTKREGSQYRQGEYWGILEFELDSEEGSFRRDIWVKSQRQAVCFP